MPHGVAGADIETVRHFSHYIRRLTRQRQLRLPGLQLLGVAVVATDAVLGEYPQGTLVAHLYLVTAFTRYADAA